MTVASIFACLRELRVADRMRALLATLLVQVVLVPFAVSQRGIVISAGGVHAAPPATPVITFRQPPSFAREHHFARRPFLFGAYLFPDYTFAWDAPTSPSVVIVETPARAPEPQPEETKTGDPLLIEWRGDHFVRFGGTQARDAPQTDYAEMALAKPLPPVQKGDLKVREAAFIPAVLVYRDGHRDEVKEYAIIGGVLYAQGNYWIDGYWTKKIEVSTLDVPATLRANGERGVRFVLPAGPHEVVTRP